MSVLSLVYSGHGVADGELPLAASAQHQESIVLQIASLGKVKIKNSKYGFYCMCISFSPLSSCKTVGLTIICITSVPNEVLETQQVLGENFEYKMFKCPKP